MSVISTFRRSSIDEIAKEMDRRGAVIETLEAEIERLRALLAAVPVPPSQIEMDNLVLLGLRPQVRTRIMAARSLLLKTGRLNRSDLQTIGGVSVPQASADIALMLEIWPGLMRYDAARKAYVPTDGVAWNAALTQAQRGAE